MVTDTRQPPGSAGQRTAAVLWWVAFVAACAINLYGIYAPSQPGPPMFPGFDKIAHLGSFALIMATGVMARLRPAVLAVVLLAHAVTSEILQAALLPARSGDVLDVLADAVGIALGWVAAVLLQRLLRARAATA